MWPRRINVAATGRDFNERDGIRAGPALDDLCPLVRGVREARGGWLDGRAADGHDLGQI